MSVYMFLEMVLCMWVNGTTICVCMYVCMIVCTVFYLVIEVDMYMDRHRHGKISACMKTLSLVCMCL